MHKDLATEGGHDPPVQRAERILRRMLPERVRVSLRRFERQCSRLVAEILRRVIMVFPHRVIAILKERLVLTARLDDPSVDVRLVIDSEIELTMRANACRKEPETAKWIRSHIRPGDVVYDVGANVGSYSLLIDKVHRGACHIYAFEPSFANFSQLNKNICLNGSAGRVVPVNMALTDVTMIGEFAYSSVLPGTARHGEESLALMGRAVFYRQPMPMYRLDDLVEQFGLLYPNHLKLDVDGPELTVLRGAERVVDDPRLRSILVEIESGRGEADAIAPWLNEKGFVMESRHAHAGGDGATANCIFVR